MAKSLLHMISNDIGQLACLYAKLHNLSRVYFGGFFIRGHPVTMHTITYSINFFTKAMPKVFFKFFIICFLILTDTLIAQYSPKLFYYQLNKQNPDFDVNTFLFCCCRVKFRPCSWDMKAILGPLEHFLKEQRRTVRKNLQIPFAVFINL